LNIRLYQRPDSKYYWMKWHYQRLLRRKLIKILNNKISVYGEKLPLKLDCITIDLISGWETVTNEGGL